VGWIQLAGLLACWLAPSARAQESTAIRITGNQVLNRETYQAILAMEPPLPTGPAFSTAAQVRLETFLHRAGYELADVQVASGPEGLVIEVDEGRLDKVIFLGTGSLRALQLKLQLAIPHKVFNRPNLERQLERIRQRYGLEEVRYELIRSGEVRHVGPQLPDLGALEGQALIPATGRYALRLFLGREGWSSGLDIDADYDFPDGLELGVGYRGGDLLFSDDRWFTKALLGGHLRYRIDDDSTYPALSRAVAEAWWATPALVGDGLRPVLRILTDLRSRQRRDLALEIYYRESLEASGWLSYEFVPGLTTALGGGLEYRVLFGVEMADPAAVPLATGDDLRPFLDGRLNFVFNPWEPRRDRHHRLGLGTRYAWVVDGSGLGQARLDYQVLFVFGWHDLVISAAGVWIWDAATFDDQEPVGGRHLRGVFGDRYWVQRVADCKLEFRFSLARDLYKLSIYHDLAVFGQLDPASGEETARVADAFGLGFHALILDLFQLDLYYGVGFSSEGGEFDHGVSASLSKVF
jgi:hypothetical protein